MALVSGGRSTLNPDAPLFIPAAFRQVEDFSPEWWQLVTTSTWYRDYWLSQHQDEDGFYDNSEEDIDGDNVADLLPDIFDFGAADDFSNIEAQFEEFIQSSETEKGNISPFSPSNKMKGHGLEVDVNGIMNSLSLLRSFEGRGPKSPVEPAKYAVKAPKSVGMKCSPRRIQQPR